MEFVLLILCLSNNLTTKQCKLFNRNSSRLTQHISFGAIHGSLKNVLRHKSGKAMKQVLDRKDETICYALSPLCVCVWVIFYVLFYCIMVFLFWKMDTQ